MSARNVRRARLVHVVGVNDGYVFDYWTARDATKTLRTFARMRRADAFDELIWTGCVSRRRAVIIEVKARENARRREK